MIKRGIILGVTALFAGQAPAELLVYEPFDYEAGSVLQDQVAPNGEIWHRMGSTGIDIPIQSGSLNYPTPEGHPDPIGNSVAYDGSGNTARLALGETFRDGILYFSYQVQVTSLAGMSTAGAFFTGFNTITGPAAGHPSVAGARVFGRLDSEDTSLFQIGIGKQSTPGLASWEPASFNVGDTLFLVGSYRFMGTGAAGETDDIARLWVNPTSFGNAEDDLPEGFLENSNGTDLIVAGQHQIESFILRQATTIIPGVRIDELRIGTTYASVTPLAGLPLLPGDANRDGRVDGEDFLIWQASFGVQEGATWDDGDFNGDGRVDGEDFLIWQAHFGSVAESGAVTPEPAALSLLMLAGAGLLARRRRGA